MKIPQNTRIDIPEHVESKPIVKEGVQIHGRPVKEQETKFVGGRRPGDVNIKNPKP